MTCWRFFHKLDARHAPTNHHLKVITLTMNENQLKEHDTHLNHVIDVLTTVSTTVRQAYPPDEPTNSFIRNATDAINTIQGLRSKLMNLGSRERKPASTDVDTLLQQLEPRILGLGDVKRLPRNNGWVGYKARNFMRRRFVSLEPCRRHLSVYVQIPFEQIHDPSGKYVHSSNEWSRMPFNSVKDINDAFRVIQQAYNHNLEVREERHE